MNDLTPNPLRMKEWLFLSDWIMEKEKISVISLRIHQAIH